MATTMVIQEQEWTLAKVSRWLREYQNWVAELEAGPPSRSCTDYSQPAVMGGGGGGSGGAPLRYAERMDDLRRRVGIVNGWLAGLSLGERLAAEYWLNDDKRSFTDVAAATGLEIRQARTLAQAIPTIILMRHYWSQYKRST
jgi:hypothetical protein